MTIQKIQYYETVPFKKYLKKLLKRYRTLDDDLSTAKKAAIELFHIKGIDNNSVELLPGYLHETLKFYKLRKFACKALKGKGSQSGIRIIYAYCQVSLSITFLEIYYKADQANLTIHRIKDYLNIIDIPAPLLYCGHSNITLTGENHE